MKNIFLKTLLLLTTLCLAIGMIACGTDGGNDADGGDGTNNGDGGNAVTPPPTDEGDPTELTLIKDGVAKFRVVTASGMDGATVKASQEFVSTLRELGVTVDDAVRDGIADKTDCGKHTVNSFARNIVLIISDIGIDTGGENVSK